MTQFLIQLQGTRNFVVCQLKTSTSQHFTTSNSATVQTLAKDVIDIIRKTTLSTGNTRLLGRNNTFNQFETDTNRYRRLEVILQERELVLSGI
jgi:hypothetical protein